MIRGWKEVPRSVQKIAHNRHGRDTKFALAPAKIFATFTHLAAVLGWIIGSLSLFNLLDNFPAGFLLKDEFDSAVWHALFFDEHLLLVCS